MTTPVIIDIVAAAILLGFAIYGARRGLFRALAGLLVIVLAIAGARVAAETLTCSVTGALVGCAAGLLLHRVLYESLVTAQWGLAWQFPAVPLLVILAATAVSVLLAVRGPSRRIRALSVTETIGAQ